MSKRSAEDPLLPERPAVQTICVFCFVFKWQSNLCLKYISVLVCGGLPVQEQRFQKFSSNANGYCMMEYCTGSILMSMERRKWSSVVLKRLQSLLLLFFGFVFSLYLWTEKGTSFRMPYISATRTPFETLASLWPVNSDEVEEIRAYLMDNI